MPDPAPREESGQEGKCAGCGVNFISPPEYPPPPEGALCKWCHIKALEAEIAQLQRDLAEARSECEQLDTAWKASALQALKNGQAAHEAEAALEEARRERGAMQERMEWTVTDNAKQRMAVDDLRSQLSSLEEERGRLLEEITAGTVSDGYHTHRELYEYRMLYNAHAAHGWLAAGIPVVKSRRHSDGEECFGGGWFIVTATLPTGQVSNHYRDEHWGLFDVPAVELPPEYDGHTPADAAERLRAALPPSPQEEG